MLAEERRQKVQKIIDEHGRVTIGEIVEKFKVSAVTAPADLDVLAERGSGHSGRFFWFLHEKSRIPRNNLIFSGVPALGERSS